MQEPEGKKLTMDDVAKALGVSKTTVSRAVSGKGRIGEETRQRVKDYIAQHNYHLNAPEKAAESSHTCNIGVVLPPDLLSFDLLFFPKTRVKSPPLKKRCLIIAAKVGKNGAICRLCPKANSTSLFRIAALWAKKPKVS